MEFLLFCLGTTVASYFMDVTNGLRMFKDVADAGYKIDLKRMSELQQQLMPDLKKINFLSMLIPVFNILQVLKKTMQYNEIRPMILDQLSAINALEEMSELEKQEYSKKPTLLNALVVPLKTDIRLTKASSMKIKTGDVTGEVFYEWHDRKSFDNITILKATGDISKLSEQDQKKKIIEAYKGFVEEGIKKYGDVDGLINAIRSNPHLDLTTKETENKEDSKQELSTREKIEKLESLKNEICSSQDTPNKNTETAKKLTRNK